MSGRPETLAEGVSLESVTAGAEIAFTLLARLPSEDSCGHDLLCVVVPALGWDAGALWERDGGRDGLVCTGTWSVDSAIEVDIGTIPSTTASQALVMGIPRWAELAADEEPSGSGQSRRTILSFPISEGGHITGVVELWRREHVAPTPEILETLNALAAPLGGWLENRRRQEERHLLLTRLSAAERRQRFLAEVSAVLAGTLDERRMLEGLGHVVASRMADFCGIHLLGEDGSVNLVALEVAGPARQETERMMGYSPGIGDEEGVGRVLRTGMPMLYPQITDALIRAVARDDDHLESLRRLGPKSVMIVPLPGRGKTLGALTLASMDPGRIYTADDLAVMEDVGRRAGLAIAGSQLYRRERATAQTLQQGLLPPALPEIPGLGVAGRYRPGVEGLLVGGDFYEAFQVADDTWIIGIGDVCGHGPAAAALSSRVRHSARALANSCGDPSELLVRTNQLLRLEPEDVSYCTAVYGWLVKDDCGARLTLARAGHPYPMLRRRDGDVVELRPRGQVLGVFDTVEIEPVTVELAAGDLVLLYTDGVTEARRNGALLGSERVMELLSETGELGADGVAQAIDELALDHSGGRLRDDVAVLVVAVETA